MVAGIGLVIAMVGLQWAGVVVAAPGTLVALGKLHSRPALLAVTALALTLVRMGEYRGRGVGDTREHGYRPAALSTLRRREDANIKIYAGRDSRTWTCSTIRTRFFGSAGRF